MAVFGNTIFQINSDELMEKWQEKAESFQETQEQAQEVVDAVVNFPFIGVVSYGFFFVLIVIVAIIVIFLLLMMLQKG